MKLKEAAAPHEEARVELIVLWDRVRRSEAMSLALADRCGRADQLLSDALKREPNDDLAAAIRRHLDIP